jgi:Cdc6-like AAA superfamily ATPase
MAPNAENFQLSLLAARVFTPGSAINEKSLFAGRIRQIRRIVDAVAQTGQHAVLYGEPGVGKTSLANVCAEFLSGAGTTVLAPRINCVTTDTFSTIWKKVFSEIEITRKVRGVGFTAAQSETTLTLIDQSPDTIRPDHVMTALHHLSYDLLSVIIIDEFDRIEDHAVRREIADTIKMLSDHQVGSTLLLVGVADSVTDLIAEHRSIERALVQIHMPRMEQEELEEIVHTGLDKLTMTIDDQAEAELISLAKGLPYFIHLLCLHASRKALDANERHITIAHLEGAIREALDSAQQTMRTAYHKATTSVRKDTIHRHVLLACSLADTDEFGYFNAASVVRPLTMIRQKHYEIPYFAQHLREFSDDKRGRILQSIGEPHSRLYRFKNPMMQPFVIMKGLSDELVSPKTLREFGQISSQGQRNELLPNH